MKVALKCSIANKELWKIVGKLSTKLVIQVSISKIVTLTAAFILNLSTALHFSWHMLRVIPDSSSVSSAHKMYFHFNFYVLESSSGKHHGHTMRYA